jgi:hypothetical protein
MTRYTPFLLANLALPPALGCSGEATVGSHQADPNPEDGRGGEATGTDGAAGEEPALELSPPCDAFPSINQEAFVPGASIYGRVIDVQPSSPDQPCAGLAGVEVCRFPGDPCTHTDADGFYALDGLPEGEQEITFVKEGYRSVLRPIYRDAGALRMLGPTMLTHEHGDARIAMVGQSPDPNRGHVVGYLSVLDRDGPLGGFGFPGGVTMDLSPASGSGPYYFHGTDQPERWALPDPTLTETTEGSGRALWINVEPGDYAVRFRSTGLDGYNCMPFPHGGFGFDESGRVRLRVRAGFATDYVGLLCF